jgi:sugar/nucleoside kinase (ribokinase family)
MVVVFGTVCIDRILRVTELPSPGGYVDIDEELLMLGGEAANTALALQSWGIDVELYPNAVGTDPEADLLVDLIRARGLPMRFLRRGNAPTPVCDVYVTPDGDRTMFGRGFKDMDDATELDALPLYAGEWFTAEPNMSVLSRQAVHLAANAGMKIYTMDFVRAGDPVPQGSFWQSSTDWAGRREDSAANLEWVRAHAQRHGCCAILTDGPRGFVVGRPGEHPHLVPAFPCPGLVDSTGAGDAFRAGMLFGLHTRDSLCECLRIAAAAGSLRCRSLGASAGVPTLDEIAGLIAAHPNVAEACAEAERPY